MRIAKAERLFEQMVEGRVYRREALAIYSKAVDRDLARLVSEKKIVKAGAGLYYRPKRSRFGSLAASPDEVVRAYLKTDDFLITSLNYFNGLAVGLTQLTNEMLVYNRKRVGRVKLDSMNYYFKRPVNYPKREEFNEEYLFVDLLNNYDDLHEPPDKERFLKSLKRKAGELRKKELHSAASRYGKASAQRMLRDLTAGE